MLKPHRPKCLACIHRKTNGDNINTIEHRRRVGSDALYELRKRARYPPPLTPRAHLPCPPAVSPLPCPTHVNYGNRASAPHSYSPGLEAIPVVLLEADVVVCERNCDEHQ